MKKRVTFKSVEDFELYCKAGNLVYYCDGLKTGYDLLSSFRLVFKLDGVTVNDIERWLYNNSDKFEIRESSNFYWPNDNMFSGDCSIHGVSGLVLKWRG